MVEGGQAVFYVAGDAEGWAASPLRLAFHPTPEQQYKEAVRWRENLENLHGRFGKRKAKDRTGPDGRPFPSPPPLEPLPEREVFLAKARAKPDERALGCLAGLCLWDVVSDNHDLILPDGSVRHIGSFRAAAGIIADFFYQKPPCEEDAEEVWDFNAWDMDYCEFYMGTWAIGGRVDLSPVYRLIFERLLALDYGWQYAFLRLGVVRFQKPEAPEGQPEWEGYDPSAALAGQEKEREEEAEFRKLQADLETAHREALEAAKKRLPPLTVQAYREVYGHWPAGWPPWEI
ncbi:MAG: hypothetical protein KIT22_10715 [Verrucomicrobiae bacterium]|nr:hypothetical protein [Verrucomicrobiae bacterium]